MELAEDDEVVQALRWPTDREHHGHDVSETVVGVQSVMTAGVPIYSAGDTAEEQLWSITRSFADTIGLWAVGIVTQRWYPLLGLGPARLFLGAAFDAVLTFA